MLLGGCSPGAGSPTGGGSGTGDDTSAGTDATVSATDSMSTTATSGATESDTQTGTDTGTTAPGCDSPAPDAFGGWALDLGDFPGGEDPELDLTIPCTITGVTVDDAAQRTRWALACDDDDGNAHTVGFDIAVSHDGPDGLAALVELPAELRVVGSQNFGGVVDGVQHTELAVANIALVGDGQLYGFVVEGPGVVDSVFAPLEITMDRDACGVDPPEDDPDYQQHRRDMSLTFTMGEVATTLFSGQWDVLTIDGGATTDTIAIDVTQAEAMTCCHSLTWVSVVGRTYREYAPD